MCGCNKKNIVSRRPNLPPNFNRNANIQGQQSVNSQSANSQSANSQSVNSQSVKNIAPKSELTAAKRKTQALRREAILKRLGK